MRVGIDASNLRAGGGVTHLASLLGACDPAEAAIEQIVVWSGRHTLARLPDRPWLSLQHEPALDRSLPHRLLWQRVSLANRATACDLLFAPGGGPAVFRPFVTMSRNLLPFQEDERRRYGASWMYVKLGLIRHSQTRAFRSADGLIFLNAYAEDAVRRVTGPIAGRTTVIPHGVDDRFRRAPRPQRAIEAFSAAAPFRLLYVSNVDVYKHQWHVVDAVRRLRERGWPVILELAGGASHAAEARLERAIATHDPEGRFVRRLGAVAHKDLPARYHAADGFVFASSCENMPNILLEAMAAGLPIVCSDRGPMPAILGDAGVFFDPLTPSTLTEALGGLLSDVALRAAVAQRAFERAVQYSWSRCAAETLAFLRSVHEHRR